MVTVASAVTDSATPVADAVTISIGGGITDTMVTDTLGGISVIAVTDAVSLTVAIDSDTVSLITVTVAVSDMAVTDAVTDTVSVMAVAHTD